MIGVIGGSSLGQLRSLEDAQDELVETPFGKPSGPLSRGRIAGHEVVFIARHGRGGAIPPHLINYRANIWALKAAGVTALMAVAAVGGIRPELVPGTLLVPDQIIDYTWGRESTYWGVGTPPTHIDFTCPYANALRAKLMDTAHKMGIELTERGTYAVTQGPRLETAAEIRRIRADGGCVVGMTGMPEAALAREAGLHYATIAVVVNHAAGVGESREAISIKEMARISLESSDKIERLLCRLCGS